jgi:putative ABC transport system substrate-binding protein
MKWLAVPLLAVALLAVALLAAPLAAETQQAGRVWRIGFLGAETPSTNGHFLHAFRLGMGEHGYVEGRNLTIQERWAEGRSDRFRELITELIGQKSDVLVISSTLAALAAKESTKTIPIVFVAGDPTGSGLVSDLARPGGNVTGLSLTLGEEFVGKWLELLGEAIPRLSRVAVLSNPVNPANAGRFTAIRMAAERLRIKLQREGVTNANQLDHAFAAMAAAGAQALVVFVDPLTVRYRARIVELAAKGRLPAIYGFREFVDSGGLMAYGSNVPALYRRAATYVDKILKGAKPGDLPVEQATQFELVINLKTAKALGLTIPQSVLMRADEVIQ